MRIPRIIIAALLSLALAPHTVSAAAAPSAASCKQIGATKRVASKQYVCSISGKKLVWKVKPASKPASSAESVWQVRNTKTEIVDAATRSFATWAGTVRSPQAAVEYRFDTTTPDELREWIPRSVAFIAQRVPPFPAKHPTVSIAATTEEQYFSFLKQSYDAEQIAIVKDQYRLAMESGAGGWTDYFVMIWNLPKWLKTDTVHSNTYGMQTIGAHEYFHIFQFNANGCDYWCMGTPRQMPMWFIEGGAAFVQFQAGEAMGYGPYAQGRQKRLDIYRADPRNARVPLSAVVDGYEVDPYGIGMAATELLVAKIGMEKYLKIISGLSTSPSFADSFKTQAGISLETFYAQFEKLRGNLDYVRSNG